MNLQSAYLCDAQDRGYLYQCSNLEELDALMNKGKICAYIGFDATADSLHVGSLMQIMRLRRLQQMGHKPIVLVGGGTTKIGDPSGKDQSRAMLDEKRINHNIAGILSVLKKFLTFGNGSSDALLINNDEWLQNLNYLQFLRDYGKHFSINRMLSFESVKMRLQREQNLSFLEFNYMILQAYDFLHLFNNHNCVLQMGGGDQWGNIIAGVELIRRVKGASAYSLTCPLITTADGAKMGKTAQGAVWLDSEKFSVFDFWQFWRNTHDGDVIKFLKFFTDLPLNEIKRFEDLQGQELNEVKILLADLVCEIVHGEIETKKAKSAVGGSGDDSGLPVIEINKSDLEDTQQLLDLLMITSLCKSRSEAKRLINGNGIKVNDELVQNQMHIITKDLVEQGFKVSVGKKRHVIIKANC